MRGATVCCAVAAAAALSRADASEGQRKTPLSFEDVRESVPHTVHFPSIKDADFGPHVRTEDLAMQLTIPVGEAGGVDRTAVVDARVATDLFSSTYEEVYHFANGTAIKQHLTDSHRRCYWRGAVTFSDGSTGSMAFTSCGRNTGSHAAFLSKLDDGDANDGSSLRGTDSNPVDPRTFETPFHFIRGVIHDHSTGQRFAVEPRHFEKFRAANAAGKNADTGFGPGETSVVGDLRLGQHVTYREQDFRSATGNKGFCKGGHDHKHGRSRASEDTDGHDHTHSHEPGKLFGAPPSQAERPSPNFDVNSGGRRNLASLGTRYVELHVANDYLRTDEHGIDAIGDDTLTLINQVAMYYGSDGVDAGLNYDIRLVLVAQSVFVDEDPWTGQGTVGYDAQGEVDVDDLLNEYSTWAFSFGSQANFNFVNTLSVNFDNSQLFSHEDFDESTIGYAWTGGMCDSDYASAAIDQSNTGFIVASTTVAHEVGHNFGMRHDGSGNACPNSGFLMAPFASTEADVTFSSCSASKFNDFTLRQGDYAGPGFAGVSCLSASAPARNWEDDGVCGDGLVSGTEDCDTAGVADSCCNANTCQFYSGSVCTPVNHACCTSTCQFIPFDVDSSTNVECRPKANACDSAEFCHGNSPDCPPDIGKVPGTSCTTTEYFPGGKSGKCYNSQCVSNDDACYERGVESGSTSYSQGSCASFNADCGLLRCNTGGGGCSFSTAYSVPDGASCGSSSQCAGGSCVSQASLYTTACGDGFVDSGAGEECDCGSGNCYGIDNDCDARDCTIFVATPRDCVGAWSNWGLCSVTCEGGTKTRSFVVTQTARLSGAECAHEDGATSTIICNTVNCSIATTTTRTTTTTSNPYPFADECPVTTSGSSTATIDCSAAVAGEICCVLPVETVCNKPSECDDDGGNYNPLLSTGQDATQVTEYPLGLELWHWIIIGVGGAILVLLLLIIACVCCCKSKSKNYEVPRRGLDPNTAPPPFRQQGRF